MRPCLVLRLKDGLQACPRCGGQGCWSCERQGVMVQCPGCAAVNQFERQDDDFTCSVCGAVFTKAGVVSRYEPIDQQEKLQKKERQQRLAKGKPTQRKPF